MKNEKKHLDREIKEKQTEMEIEKLPEECISIILSLTSPRDACRAATLSKIIRSAADSDTVWNIFLPSDYLAIIGRFDDTIPMSFDTKKKLYLHLSDSHYLIEKRRMSFSLDRESGKKCFMITARDLHITWGESPAYWDWISLPYSRFAEVAKLKYVWWLEVCSKINTKMLSSSTNHAVYLVYKLPSRTSGFNKKTVDVSMKVDGVEGEVRTKYLGRDRKGRYPKERKDGWWEMEFGEYFNEGREDHDLEMILMEVNCGEVKTGLIIEGIEIRPKGEDRSTARNC